MQIRQVLILAGLFPLFIGFGQLAGIIPNLSVVNTVTINQPNVTCGSSGSCSATLTITNNNATSNFAIYLKVTNVAYQNIWKNTLQVQYAVSSFTTPALSLGTLPPGAYIFSAFAVSNQGVVISQTASMAFNVGGNYKLYIDPYNPSTGSVSVSPPCSINPSTQSTCSYPVGTPVTVTYNPASGYVFGQWCYWASGSTLTNYQGCTTSGTFGQTNPSIFTSTSNPLTFTMNSNYELVYSVSQSSLALNIQYFTVTPTISITGGCPISPSSQVGTACPRGTVTPSSTTKIYSLESASYGATSATFTATPATNMTFVNFQVNGKNFTQNPLSLNYSELKSVQTVSGQLDFQLYSYFKAKQFYQLGVGAYAGITTSPAAKNSGTYYYPAGASVTITVANVASNVCFTGWLVDGNDAGTANSVTVTMNSYHSVFAQGVGKPATGCSSAGDGGGSSAGFLPFAFIGGGATLMVLGLSMKRKQVG